MRNHDWILDTLTPVSQDWLSHFWRTLGRG